MDVGQPGRVLDGVLPHRVHAEGNVMGNGVREQEVVLGHIGAGRPHRPDGQGVHVLPVHEQAAVRHIINAQDQVHQGGLARAGLAHDAHPLAAVDGEGDIFQHVELPVRVAEGQVAELDLAFCAGQVVDAGPVGHVHRRVQQLGDPVEGRLAAGSLFDQHGHRHDGPDDGRKVADVFHQLAGIEPAGIDQVPAIAQDHAGDRLDKEGDKDVQQGGDTGVDDVDLLIFPVQLAEGHQLFGLLDKSFDHRDARKVFLGKVGQVGKGLLPLFPAAGHHTAHDAAHQEHQEGGDHRHHGQGGVHPPHLDKGQQPQEQSVAEHQHAVAEALLDGLQVVGVQAHQVAHLVHLVVGLGQVLAVVEHPVAQLGLHPDGRPEKADAPQKPADHHGYDDADHGQADVLHQHGLVERGGDAPHQHLPAVDPVDEHPVQLGDDQLHIVHQDQRRNAEQKRGRMAEVVAVDILAEDHVDSSFFTGWRPGQAVRRRTNRKRRS